jgi:hypothetical protein
MMNRNADDERVLSEIGKTNVHFPGNKLNIFDARSNVAAHANRFKGGGIENVNYYTNCEVHFCDIANIHGVRDGIEKMYSMGQTEVLNNPQKYLQALENSGYMQLASNILSSVNKMLD